MNPVIEDISCQRESLRSACGVTSAPPASSTRPAKESDERDGADPSDRTARAPCSADRQSGRLGRGPPPGARGHLRLGDPSRAGRRDPAHQRTGYQRHQVRGDRDPHAGGHLFRHLFFRPATRRCSRHVALLAEATRLSVEPLVCNQIEMHPYLDQSKVVEACKAHGMAVVAYSPIARGNAHKDAGLARIGKMHGKTAAQISLRFLVQQRIAVIPRTSRIERLSENIALFDFSLSEPEMAEIAALARRGTRMVDYSYSGQPKWD